MTKAMEKQIAKGTGDLVLQELWQAKDALSATYGHDLDKLVAETRKRQKRSGHRVVNLQQKKSAEMKQTIRAKAPKR